MIMPPLTTTPSDTQASLSMCQKALRYIQVIFRAVLQQGAMERFATKLIKAISMTHPSGTGTGP